MMSIEAWFLAHFSVLAVLASARLYAVVTKRQSWDWRVAAGIAPAC